MISSPVTHWSADIVSPIPWNYGLFTIGNVFSVPCNKNVAFCIDFMVPYGEYGEIWTIFSLIFLYLSKELSYIQQASNQFQHSFSFEKRAVSRWWIGECNELFFRGPFRRHWLTLIAAWICNNMPTEVWDTYMHPFPNFNGCTVEVWEWMSSFISHSVMNIYPCWYGSQNMLHPLWKLEQE